MSNLNYEEHISCSNYVCEVHLGFKYVEVDKGAVFSVDDKKENHLFFFIEGDVLVRYNEFPNQRFGKNEMVFLPKSADCHGEALTDCKFLLLIYDAPIKQCDKVGFVLLLFVHKVLILSLKVFLCDRFWKALYSRCVPTCKGKYIVVIYMKSNKKNPSSCCAGTTLKRSWQHSFFRCWENLWIFVAV